MRRIHLPFLALVLALLVVPARAKEAAKDKHAKDHRRHASLGWSAAARAMDAAVLAAGGTPPTTWAPGADGLPAFPIEAAKRRVEEAEAKVQEIMNGLQPPPQPLPESWPMQALHFEAEVGEKQGLLELRASLKGDWVHVQAALLPAAGSEPVAEFSDTLITTGWSGIVRETLPFDIPEPGSYVLQVRAVTGRDGWLAAAPPRSGGKLAVTVRQGKPAGAGAAGGALFFFMWFWFEVFLRMAQYVFYVIRLGLHAVGIGS